MIFENLEERSKIKHLILTFKFSTFLFFFNHTHLFSGGEIFEPYPSIFSGGNFLTLRIYFLGGNFFERGKDFSIKELSFAINSNFLIPISFKPDSVNLISNLGFFIVHKIHSMKYQRSTTSGCTDIKERFKFSSFWQNLIFFAPPICN